MATGALDILWAMLCCSRICHGVSACLLLLKTGMLLDYYDSKRCFESPYAPGNGAQRLGSIRRNRNWLLTLLLGSHFFSQLRLSPKQFVDLLYKVSKRFLLINRYCYYLYFLQVFNRQSWLSRSCLISFLVKVYQQLVKPNAIHFYNWSDQ